MSRWGARFLNRIFTPPEQRYCLKFRNPSLHFAGRFAVKEALFKAIGTGWSRGVSWTDIEVTNEPGGRPHAAVSGRTGVLVKRLGGETIFVSISHDTDYSIGQVLITKRPAIRTGAPAKRRSRG